MNSLPTKIHPSFRIDGFSLDPDHPEILARKIAGKGDAMGREIAEFLLEWTRPGKTVELQTSGSTGKPKKIRVTKEAMANSARATGEFFGLKSGDTALLCLPVQYIAGKMMLVRAMVLGLELDVLEPTSAIRPEPQKKYAFCAMVPMQLAASREILGQFATVIVGGAAVPKALEEQLSQSPSEIYATYGMTETLTHVAVRKLGKGRVYTAMPDVELSLNDNDCLIINAPHLTSEPITTRDVVKLHSEKSFELLGRLDNVVNSGGVKLFPEMIELKLKDKIDVPFFLSAEEDPELGQRLILVIEQPGDERAILSLFDELHPYEKPRRIYAMPSFEYTESGKINRRRTMKLLRGSSVED